MLKARNVSILAQSQACSQCKVNSARAYWTRFQGVVGVSVCFMNLRIASLIFADSVPLLVYSGHDLLYVLERFAAEREASRIRVSSSNSEVIVLDRKKTDCHLWIEGQSLLQVNNLKYLGALGRLWRHMENGALVTRQRFNLRWER